MTTTIIKEIGSYKFNGFYESPFLYSEEFLDFEIELETELKEKMGTDKDITINLEYENINEYMKDIAKEYMTIYIEKIKEVLPEYITDSSFFKLEPIDKKIIIDSPQYYNYRTDLIFMDIKTNIETLNLIKWHTLNLKGAKEYINHKFKSCDDFISFIKNNIDYWKDLKINEYETNYLISLLDMLLTLKDRNIFEYITCEVLDNICKYDYACPYVYYNNMKLELYKFEELLETNKI